MALRLLVGPANAGKVAALLDRYLADLPRDPVLIVPNAADVERVERELLARAGALLGGWIATFDDLFGRIAAGNGRPPVATAAQRALVLRRVVARAGTSAPSARHPGFAEALGSALAEVESGLLEPSQLDGELGPLYTAYREELERLGVTDQDAQRRHAAERVASDLAAWDESPVYAYGFEDLTAAQWRLLEALAARSAVTVSLPYEPGRAAFASLERTASDLAALAEEIEELPPRYAEFAPPALAHLERALFSDEAPGSGPPIGGAVRFLEAAGTRATLELVADEILSLLRAGTTADEVAVVCPSLDRYRAPLEAAFGALEVPYVIEEPALLAQTPFGYALLSLLRYAWLAGGRRELFAFARSPYSGLTRAHADFVEGRLRGRAIEAPDRVEAQAAQLRGGPLPFLERLRSAPTSLAAVGELSAAMIRAAHGVDSPPTSGTARADLRAHQAVSTVVRELEDWVERGGELTAREIVETLERAPVRADPAAREGRVAVIDLMRARTRRVEIVFVLGLEEGVLPRRASVSPFLDDDARRARPRARLERPDRVSRDRFLFYSACTRPSRRLYLVREAANDEGSPRAASPFWDDVQAAFAPGEVARATRRRPLSELVWRLDAAPTERERLRSLVWLWTSDAAAAEALARANGWERKLARAARSFERDTALRHPAVLAELLERTSFGVTELEAFADCSSIWLVDRLIDPRTIDAEVDARLRGQVAHQALFRFYAGLPKEVGSERVTPELLEPALRWLRSCLDEALAGYVDRRLDLRPLERRELEHGLWRDLEASVRREAEADSPLVPRRFEVSFGSERSAPELQRGLDLGGFSVTGKIDRIDVDPFSARGVVHDYKSGKTAHSAAQIERDLRLQIPLYMLVLRDLVGVEPLGGLYRPLAGTREPRGLLRADARDDGLPGYARNDYLDDETFWARVEGARATAARIVERIRRGDVRHDPRGDAGCHTWCERAPVCRVRRG